MDSYFTVSRIKQTEAFAPRNKGSVSCRLIAERNASPNFIEVSFAGSTVVFAVDMKPPHDGASRGMSLPRFETQSRA